MGFRRLRARNVAPVQVDQGGEAAPRPSGVGPAPVDDSELLVLPPAWEAASRRALTALQRDSSRLTNDSSRLLKSIGALRAHLWPEAETVVEAVRRHPLESRILAIGRRVDAHGSGGMGDSVRCILLGLFTLASVDKSTQLTAETALFRPAVFEVVA